MVGCYRSLGGVDYVEATRDVKSGAEGESGFGET